MIWTLNDGVNLVRAVQDGARQFGYHVTIGGGVVNRGISDKDVDLYFLPYEQSKSEKDPKGLVEWLTKMWGEPDPLGPSGIETFDRRKVESYAMPNGEISLRIVDMPLPPSVYSNKLKFVREAGDRIDVFVL